MSRNLFEHSSRKGNRWVPRTNRFDVDEKSPSPPPQPQKEKRVSFQRSVTPPPSPKLPKEKVGEDLSLSALTPTTKEILRQKIRERLVEERGLAPNIQQTISMRLTQLLSSIQ